jgi:two-component system, NtrC family, response regulator GlrR
MSGAESRVTTALGATEIVFDRFAIKVVTGPDEGAEVVSTGEETTVGTDPGNDLVLSDRSVSRHHVAIRVTARGLELRDLGSTNGTVLGGYRVMSALVKPGALIGCGRTVLRLDLTGDEVRETLSEQDRFGRALGASEAMRRVFALLERFAPAEGTVLLEGETGTGKELLAQALHQASGRANGPFVVVDCGAIPSTLIEAELFGHVRGAFTDARETRRGAFESARGGTLFLDEIGELPAAVQPVLLRVLEDRTVKRVGDDRRIPVDVRVVAATHRDLRGEVNRGHFRADLYYRLAVLRVRVPALRERREDIPLLVRHFCDTLGATGDGEEPASLPDELVTALAAQSWPGNVRELRSAVQRAILLGDAATWRDPLAPEPDPIVSLGQTYGEAKERATARWEAVYVRRLIEMFDGNLTRAARAVGMSRNHLRKLAERHGARG